MHGARRVPRLRAAALTVALMATALTAGAAAAPPAGAASSSGELEGVRADRERLASRLADAAERLEDVSARIDQNRSARATLEADVEALEADADRAGDALEAVAVERYQDQQDPLMSMLGADRPEEALEQARALSGFGRKDREAIELADAARTAIVSRRAELDDLEEQLADDEAALTELRAELDAAFDDAVDREQELESRRSRQRQVSRRGQEGTYACPLGEPYTFRDTWGAPRSGGRSHKGVDMFAPMGIPVYAMTDGVITRQSQSRLGGLGLYLRGDDGNEYYYAHLERILSAYDPGTRVEAGEQVATNGDSGNARGGAPHVHLQVHPGGGGPVNPYPYSAAACF